MVPTALAVGCLGLLLSLPDIAARPLSFDELFDGMAVRESWHGLVSLISETEASQALWLLGLKQWASIAPEVDWWLRVPAAVAGAAAAALLVAVGARCLDRLTGALAGTFLVANAFVLSWMQQARTYALAVFAAVLVTALFVRALDRGTAGSWVLYGLAVGLGVYAQFYVAFMPIVHALALSSAPTRPRARYVALAGSVAVPIVAPAAWFAATADREQLSWLPDPRAELVARSLYWNSGWSVPALVLAGVGTLALARRALAGEWWPASLLVGWAALPTLLGIVVSRHVHPILAPQYAIVSAPALALLAAFGVTTIARTSRRVATLTAIIVFAFAGYERIEHANREVTIDWHGAASYLAEAVRPGDAVIVLPAWVRPAMEFYAPDLLYRDRITSGVRRVFISAGCGDEDGLVRKTVEGTGVEPVGPAAEFGRDLCVYPFASDLSGK